MQNRVLYYTLLNSKEFDKGEDFTDTGIAFSFGPITVRWYGILISAAILLGVFFAERLAKKLGENPEHLLNMAILVVPAAIVGARCYYILFNWHYYRFNPGEIIAVWHGGLAIHGAILAGLFTVFCYVRRHQLVFRRWLDIFCPALVLGQAIGRWGNFFNQEAYGYETNVPWAMYIGGAYRHPTFLYEFLWDLAVFLLLWYLIRKARYKTGDIAAVYFFAYSLGRCFIEPLRMDSLMLGPIRMAVAMSIFGMLAGLVLYFYNRKHPVKG